jgi:hypothetical protein
MHLWFTRPEMWSVLVKGIERCTVWLSKPEFDAAPRGGEDPLYAELARGWRVSDVSLQPEEQLRCQVGDLLDEHPDVIDALFLALSLSIDGKPPGDDCYERWWQIHDDNDFLDNGKNEFLLELDVPPELWWRIARSMSDVTVEQIRYDRLLMESDCPF